MGLPGVICVICVVLFIVVPAAAGALLSWYLSHPRERTYQDHYFFTPFETGVPFERVSFVTSDGVTLRGWWLPGNGERAVIGLNGRMGSKSDLLGVGTYLNRAGFHVLLFDYRGCGESDPAAMSMGQLETADAAAAVEYALFRIPGGRIGIIGFSLGAGLGLVTAAADRRVRAVVCDSPFASSEGIVLNRLKSLLPLPLVLVRLWTRWWTQILYRYDTRGLDVVGAAGRVKDTKLLFVISGRDSVIPPDQQRRVARAAPEGAVVW